MKLKLIRTLYRVWADITTVGYVQSTTDNVDYIEVCDELVAMAVQLSPTRKQRAILERLDVPKRVAAILRQTSFALEEQDAEAVRDALAQELARRGFGASYAPTAEGRLIEDLIDDLFIR